MVVRTVFFFILSFTGSMIAQERGAAQEESAKSEFRVAVVDIQDLFQDYRKTLAAEREIDLARADIQKKSQLATNEIQGRRQLIEQRILKVRKGEVSAEEEASLRRELPILTRELQMAEKQKQAERNQANQKLNQQMVRRMEGILEELVELTAKKAEAEGFDLVIDSSGSNSSQVLPVLYSRNATDITEIMRKELSKSASKER